MITMDLTESTTESTERENPKRAVILRAASEAFHELGYDRTSVDEIVRRAGVSKPTVYNHFADKRALFSAFVVQECQENARRIFALAHGTDDLRLALSDIAHGYARMFLSPFVQSIVRIILAQVPQFPEIGRVFYEAGPELGHQRLVALIDQAVAKGELAAPDTDIAAHQFIELCRADLFYKLAFGVVQGASEVEVDRVADAAVETFLRAFGTADLRQT
jgi:TetR/AcrR family transcriptional regulator, mexJK operon transcriptional repressor